MKDFFAKIFTLRSLFLWGNVILLVLFLMVMAKDHKRGWKDYQKEYKKLEIDRAQKMVTDASTEEEKVVADRALKAAKRIPIELKQIWIEDINAVDRCITCHQGYDPLNNTSMTTPYENHPFSASAESPEFDIHKAHDVTKFGCVSCHGGQGLATETEPAHGFVKHWETPLLKDVALQASCFKCHDNLSDLKVNDKIYPSEVIRGQELFLEHGCIGCHQVGGEGGPISVDLKAETSAKPLSRIDFAYTGLEQKDRTLENWIKLHFTKDPTELVPGDPKGEFNTEPIAPSGMPPYLMGEEDANAITAYILGLNRKGIPPEYLVVRPPAPEPRYSNPIKRGEWVYEKYGCAGCHGSDARGGIRAYNYQYDVTPNLRQAVATYTRSEMREKLHVGVPILAKLDSDGPQPPFYMPPWEQKINKQEMEDLITYLFSIKE